MFCVIHQAFQVVFKLDVINEFHVLFSGDVVPQKTHILDLWVFRVHGFD